MEKEKGVMDMEFSEIPSSRSPESGKRERGRETGCGGRGEIIES